MSRRKLLTRSLHPQVEPLRAFQSITVTVGPRLSDEGRWHRQEKKVKIRKKKTASLHFAGLTQRLSSSPLVDLTGTAAGERASEQGRGNVVSVGERSFLKGAAPLLLRCRREGRLGDHDVTGNASAEDRRGRPLWRKCQSAGLDKWGTFILKGFYFRKIPNMS